MARCLVISASYVTVEGFRCTGGSGISIAGSYSVVKNCLCVGPGGPLIPSTFTR